MRGASLDKPYILKFKKEGKTDLTVEHHCTASIGVVMFVNHDESQDHLLKWAAGGNQVVFYDSTDPTPSEASTQASRESHRRR